MHDVYCQTPQSSNKRSSTQSEVYRISRYARNAETSGQLERALELWQAVNQIRPGCYSAYHGIRRCLTGLGHYDEALRFLAEMMTMARSGKIQLDPITIAADRAEVIFVSQDEESGKREVEKLLKELRGNPKIYRELSSVLASQRLSDESIAVLQRGRAECNDPYLFARDLSRWFEAHMHWESAIDEYLLYLQEDPKHFTFVTGAFGDMAVESRVDSIIVSSLSQKLRKTDGEYQKILRKLLASLHFRAQRYDKALAQYKILEHESGDQGKELLEFARLVSSEGEHRLAWDAYSEILAGNPGRILRAQVLLGKGMAAEALGEIDSAATAYQEVLAPGVPPSAVFEAYYHLGNVKFDYIFDDSEARKYFNKAIDLAVKAKMPPTRIDVLRIDIALTHEREGDFKQAEKILRKLVRKTGRHRQSASSARFELANLYFRRGELEKAENEVTALLAASPASMEANDALELKALLADLKDTDEVLQAFGSADLARFQRKPETAKQILNNIVNNRSNRAREEAFWRLYSLALDQEQYDEATKTIENIIKIPTALRRDMALLLAGDLYAESLENPQRAIAYYEQLLIDYPDSPLADQARRRMKDLAGNLL